MLQQILKQLLQFLSTPTGLWTLAAIGGFIAFAAIYHQKRQIPGFTIESIMDDTWFINRDDNHRLAIIVSLRLINKSGSPIRIGDANSAAIRRRSVQKNWYLMAMTKRLG